jgi:hypothetical protein
LLCITEVPCFENDCPHLDFISSYIIFQHPVAILKLQYHLIFSLYATFNMIFVSIISTLHVSEHIGHLQVSTELCLLMLTF